MGLFLKHKTMANKKTTIEFLQSPTGKFGLGYHVGDQTDSLDAKQIAILIDEGYAKKV